MRAPMSLEYYFFAFCSLVSIFFRGEMGTQLEHGCDIFSISMYDYAVSFVLIGAMCLSDALRALLHLESAMSVSNKVPYQGTCWCLPQKTGFWATHGLCIVAILLVECVATFIQSGNLGLIRLVHTAWLCQIQLACFWHLLSSYPFFCMQSVPWVSKT